MSIHRVTARVFPVSPTGAVLLLQEQDPARPGELYWSSIGGAVDAGESLPEAAVRELREETGIVVGADRLTAPVHRAVQAYSWDGVDYVADSTYFVVSLGEHVEVNFDHLEPEEVGNVLAAEWWKPSALAGAAFRPPDLPEIMTTGLSAYADHPRQRLPRRLGWRTQSVCSSGSPSTLSSCGSCWAPSAVSVRRPDQGGCWRSSSRGPWTSRSTAPFALPLAVLLVLSLLTNELYVCAAIAGDQRPGASVGGVRAQPRRPGRSPGPDRLTGQCDAVTRLARRTGGGPKR